LPANTGTNIEASGVKIVHSKLGAWNCPSRREPADETNTSVHSCRRSQKGSEGQRNNRPFSAAKSAAGCREGILVPTHFNYVFPHRLHRVFKQEVTDVANYVKLQVEKTVGPKHCGKPEARTCQHGHSNAMGVAFAGVTATRVHTLD
jgi:hypothetical protein